MGDRARDEIKPAGRLKVKGKKGSCMLAGVVQSATLLIWNLKRCYSFKCIQNVSLTLGGFRPIFFMPSSRIALVYQSFCSRTIADQL